ncbi:hypothetical protein NPIL_416791 [Nephila pilipes]|uniref:Uncharacterized protein n=1 Tax=Nephila pilipes TaxID=299642 RepID=A0A8X6MVZ5_NEPPI|nr:hypothetical protein NPIL_416791 [Nephila pilipes]
MNFHPSRSEARHLWPSCSDAFTRPPSELVNNPFVIRSLVKAFSINGIVLQIAVQNHTGLNGMGGCSLFSMSERVARFKESALNELMDFREIYCQQNIYLYSVLVVLYIIFIRFSSENML